MKIFKISYKTIYNWFNRWESSRMLGLDNKLSNDFKAYVSEQTITTEVVIACIDTFFTTVNKPTVIVVAQSSIHISDAIFDKIPAGRNAILLYLFYRLIPLS